jgi:D-arginine dehydrogenase
VGVRPKSRRPGGDQPLTDFVVVGGGIAGASAAAHLAPHGSVTIVEAESNLTYHTTGRSAAVYVVNYGGVGTRPLSAASQGFLADPPEGVTDGPLLSDRGLLWIGDEDRLPTLETMANEASIPGYEIRMIAQEAVLEMVPVLRPERVAGGAYEPGAMDIDVAALHQAFIRMARRHGAEIRTGSPVTSIRRSGKRWTIEAGGSSLECSAVINAAGAWGDRVAAMADVDSVGLQPRRRTAFMVPGSADYSKWPMVVEADHSFYFKPDGSQILCSLAEEEPDEPGDPKPRMEDVALAVERINEATTLDISTVSSQWTGLRTFAPDREMVIGEDPTASGFFWLVGLGGLGIATAPGYGTALAALVTGEEMSADLAAAGFDPEVVSPARFRS